MTYFACYRDLFGDRPNMQEFYEIGDHGYPIRQVLLFPDAVVSSRVDYDEYLPGGTLGDQPFDTMDQTGLVEISKEEFETAWNRPDPRKSKQP
jgi:hypothetical protein